MARVRDSRETRGAGTGVFAAAVAGALFVLSPALALGQDAQKTAMAQSLYDEAMKDFKAAKYDEACPKLERVVTLVPQGIGAKVDLGACYEAAGKLASAFGAFLTAESAARAQGDARAAQASERAAALKPKLASLTIEVPAEVKAAGQLSIKRDGVAFDAAEFGLPLFVDKGEHVVIVTAAGRAPWEKRLTVNDGDKAVLKVELGAEGGSTPPPDDKPPPDPGAGKTGTGGQPPAAAKGESAFMTPLRVVGLVGGALGLIGVGAGIGIGVHAKGLYDDSNDGGGCDAETNRCTQAGLDLRDDAVSFGTISTGVTIASAVIGAAGIVLFAVAPSEEAEASPSPTAGVSDLSMRVAPGFVTLSGSFH
jgi:hypothetical protein